MYTLMSFPNGVNDTNLGLINNKEKLVKLSVR